MNATRNYILFQIKQKISEKKAENIEKSIYNYVIQYSSTHMIQKSWEDRLFTHVYKIKACDVLNKLRPDVIKNIEEKKISAKRVAFDKDNHEDDVDESEITDGIFQCRNCGSKKTTYYSLQTRSADEPMTNFITCVHCKHRWKM
jgi:DNA-directed RNA polymerase subunit M/transcription elongation factor TFIIS